MQSHTTTEFSNLLLIKSSGFINIFIIPESPILIFLEIHMWKCNKLVEQMESKRVKVTK